MPHGEAANMVKLKSPIKSATLVLIQEGINWSNTTRLEDLKVYSDTKWNLTNKYKHAECKCRKVGLTQNPISCYYENILGSITNSGLQRNILDK